MTNWPKGKCGNCGFSVNTKLKCDRCGTIGCHACVGNTPKGFCKTCKKNTTKTRI